MTEGHYFIGEGRRRMRPANPEEIQVLANDTVEMEENNAFGKPRNYESTKPVIYWDVHQDPVRTSSPLRDIIRPVLNLREVSNPELELLPLSHIQLTLGAASWSGDLRIYHPPGITTFETSFFAVVGAANTIINRADKLTQSFSQSQTNSVLSNQSPSEINTITGHVKLPTINIPTFSGAYELWLNFRDTYSSLIHENFSLSNVQKFHYLRSSLADEAAEQIQTLETTDANYDIAWSMLKERYENNNLIINSHIDAIFDIPSLTEESYDGIRQIHSGIEKNIRSLGVLGVPVDGWDMILINIIMSKLDPVTLRDWKGVKIHGKIPTIKEMLKFLSERCQMLQGLKSDKVKANQAKPASQTSRMRHTSKTLLTTDSGYCNYCKGSHLISACNSFLKLPIRSRIDEARKKHLCLNCLKKRHSTNDCRNPLSCEKCSGRHNTVLHLEQREKLESSNLRKLESEVTALSSLTACSTTSKRKQILLATALIIIKDRDGNPHECRALLDSASQSNFVTEDLCRRLKLNTKPIQINISGIGQGESRITRHINFVVNSRLNSFKAKLSCLVLPHITANVPNVSFDIDDLNIPDDLQLADPEFFESGPVDLLIGASIFWDLLCQGQIRLGSDLPTLQKTQFGWIVSGSLSHFKEINKTLCHLVKVNDLDDQMRRFWEIEEQYLVSNSDKLKNNSLEDFFKDTTQVTPDGRFIVTLPHKDQEIDLGDSKEIAIKRFLSLERKLIKQKDLKLQYDQFIKEYIDLGHMTKLENIDPKDVSYYIPHHPVFKLSSLTTKLRVVFDGSAKTTNGKSLNDVLLPGPAMQNDLFEILLRFRKHLFVITADIAKMYRQVLINNSQRPLQRIIWRFNPQLPLDVYELNTLTYGTAPAAYLSIRCLFEIALSVKDTLPSISKIIFEDFFVDDLLTGKDSVNELKYIYTEISRILRARGFELRKWSSNSREFLECIQACDEQDVNFTVGMNEDFKTLGLLWNPGKDVLFFTVNLTIKGHMITKRQILSCIAQIFDPLGFLTPFATVVKIILQKLWQLKLSWDESIPLDLRTRWLSLRENISALDDIKIPRHVLCVNPINVQLHAFSDASEVAYGAVSEIHENVGKSYWHHIDGVENPADILSRGLDPKSLRDSQLWWNGSVWLERPVSEWPIHTAIEVENDICIPEEKIVSLVAVDEQNTEFLSAYSNFSKLRRIIGYCLRFVHNLKHKGQDRNSGILTTNELRNATIAICKFAQREKFTREIDALNKGKNVSNKSKILPLSPFLDDGLLRVGGRIKNSNFDYAKKHPILLPKSRITKLIIENEHKRLCHAGTQAVLASLREMYWPISGRGQVREVVRKCVKCYRAKPRSAVAYMGDLPESRLLQTRPFLRTGVDYAGPFAIKDRKTRGAKITKAYVCLFVCFSTKAIHLELVGDLTSDNFLSALRRFVSRRGKPSDDYSDNGTNFVGARRELAELTDFLLKNESTIIESAVDLSVQWHFIPPRSPHFGGLWEAGVKTVKGHLKRILTDASLVYEDFYSVLVQVEACVNSRPLSPLSDDPNDLLPLTPAHFLLGETLLAVPDPDLSHISENRLSKFQRMQMMVQHFWKRWSAEYIAELQVRAKWRTRNEPSIRVGTLVIIKEDNLPPVQWKMGRIIEVQLGADGIARVAKVHTSLGTYKRAITKLCPLPFEENS
ncbi:uncharacterized protein LOC127287913 [Leptopilina boulardi]|uniref:uncharacterized protein LOC127287913 n=1 Tax=Leptopilina boulardi TaxID=63433 RepID=UPI0021F5A027|nr:uncharacterized protein LOC127287913 [Leptopilina boulardi]